MSDSEKAILIFGLLGLGLLFLFTRGGSNSRYSEEASYPDEESIAIPLKLKPISKRAHHYTNEETWDISWSEDGLPTKVVIHRKAVQT